MGWSKCSAELGTVETRKFHNKETDVGLAATPGGLMWDNRPSS